MSLLYKFLTENRESPNGTGRWTVGRWRSVKGVLVPCSNGLHGTTSDNLLPFLDETLWRIEVDEGSDLIWHNDKAMGRKLVARRMRIVEQVETWNARNARLWACDVAERVLKNFEDRYPDDRRPRDSIDAARRFARGDATREELRAADIAAYSAASRASDRPSSSAAYSAAYSAASSAAYSAAYSASSMAADMAASSAASSASYSAAYSAASSAAEMASYSAEREWQRRHLADMLGLIWGAPEAEQEAHS